MTPSIVVQRYFDEVWNAGNVELIRTICADPVTRHYPARVVMLSHEEQIARITAYRAEHGASFTAMIRVCEGPYVTTIWNGELAASGTPKAGIEVFKVEGGRITDVWNNTSEVGHWG